MARQKVEKIVCDRCKKLEFVPVSSEAIRAAFAFKATFPDGEEISFEDLCDKCSKTIDNIKADIKEWDRERKFAVIALGPKINSEEAAPLSVAPNYSPPQPHSNASLKR